MEDHNDQLRSTEDFRDWTGLPWDVLSEIFLKVGTVCQLLSLQFVCRQWGKLAHDSQIWRHIHINYNDFFLYMDKEKVQFHINMSNIESLELDVVDRSAGNLEQFTVESNIYLSPPHSYRLLRRIAKRYYIFF